MRLIAGKFKGRNLNFPPSSITRPTSDRARQAVFNILMHDPEVTLTGARVLDLFAGSGAMGLEALSRGAQQVIFVESHPTAVSIIQDNIRLLGVQDQTKVIRGDATILKALGELEDAFDLVFLDPPYGKGLAEPALTNLRQQGYFSPQTLIVLEIPTGSEMQLSDDGLIVTDQRIYGAATFLLLRVV